MTEGMKALVERLIGKDVEAARQTPWVWHIMRVAAEIIDKRDAELLATRAELKKVQEAIREFTGSSNSIARLRAAVTPEDK